MNTASAALYRTIWRWHFYAGVIVAPFMVILALTGAIYLFNDEINDVLHREKRIVRPVAQSIPLSRMIEAAVAQLPGAVATRIDTPKDPDRSAEIFVKPAKGEPRRVFVDPGTGTVLGSYVYSRTLVGFADVFHGSLFMGDFGDAIVELAACWGFILTVTGLYLWWPKGRTTFRGVITPRWASSGRTFWRSLHSAVGAWTALLIMFLIITGLPWATIWGGLLRQGADSAGIGYPKSFRGYGAPASGTETIEAASQGAAPWTTQKAPAPQSAPAGHHGHGLVSGQAQGHAISIDRVAEILAGAGMRAPYRLSLPRDATGVFLAFTYPDHPETQRSLYIDQYDGRIIGDVRFADYGVAAKAVELGVQIHMGNYFGRANQIVMLLPCLSIVILAITGPYMWWLRRPKGQLAAPRVVAPLTLRAIALITIGLGLVFPLAGASLVVVVVLDSVLRHSLGSSRGAIER
ncbi:MAG: PepSY domain-containing protein [Hyphomicrobiaceae bacterium]